MKPYSISLLLIIFLLFIPGALGLTYVGEKLGLTENKAAYMDGSIKISYLKDYAQISFFPGGIFTIEQQKEVSSGQFKSMGFSIFKNIDTGYIKVNKKGEIFESNFLAGDGGGTYSIGNNKINLLSKARLIFKNNRFNMILPDGSNVKEISSLLFPEYGSNIIEISGKNIRLPSGDIMDSGSLSYLNSDFNIKSKSSVSINGIILNTKESPLTLCFEDDCEGNFIKFSNNNVKVNGQNVEIFFDPKRFIGTSTPNSNQYDKISLSRAANNKYFKLGDKGEDIKLIQHLISVSETSVFDKTTKDALKIWQSNNGLIPDGEFGKNSLNAALNLNPIQTTKIAIGEGEVEINKFTKKFLLFGPDEIKFEISAKGKVVGQIGSNLFAVENNNLLRVPSVSEDLLTEVPFRLNLLDSKDKIMNTYDYNKAYNEEISNSRFVFNKKDGSGQVTSSSSDSVKGSLNYKTTIYRKPNPKISSDVTVFAANDEKTLNAIKEKQLNGDYYYRELPKDISSSVLVVTGHHPTGNSFFYGEEWEPGAKEASSGVSFGYDEFPASDKVEIVILSGCHTAMDPTYQEGRAKPNTKYLIDMFKKKYPNLKAIVGYDSKAATDDSEFWANYLEGLDAVKNDPKTLKDYTIRKSIEKYGIPTSEKYAEPHMPGSVETGKRLGVLLTGNDNQWKFYSPFHINDGVEIKNYGTLQQRIAGYAQWQFENDHNYQELRRNDGRLKKISSIWRGIEASFNPEYKG